MPVSYQCSRESGKSRTVALQIGLSRLLRTQIVKSFNQVVWLRRERGLWVDVDVVRTGTSGQAHEGDRARLQRQALSQSQDVIQWGRRYAEGWMAVVAMDGYLDAARQAIQMGGLGFGCKG